MGTIFQALAFAVYVVGGGVCVCVCVCVYASMHTCLHVRETAVCCDKVLKKFIQH